MRILLPGNRALAVTLNDGAAAAKLAAALPQEIRMSRWGDGEYYGALAIAVASKEARREVFEVGEVALWPEGNAFCIFFGPTPASRAGEPRMASPGIALGRIESDTGVLATLGATIDVTLEADGD